MIRPEDALRIGEHVDELVERLQLARKFMPSAVAQTKLRLGGEPFIITIRPAPEVQNRTD